MLVCEARVDIAREIGVEKARALDMHFTMPKKFDNASFIDMFSDAFEFLKIDSFYVNTETNELFFDISEDNTLPTA